MKSHLKEVQSQVDEMNKAFGHVPRVEEGVDDVLEGTDAPTTDAPVDDDEDVTTDPPSTESPSTDAPSTDAPTTDAPVEEDKDEIIRKLREEIEKSKGSDHPKTEAPKTESPSTDAPLSLEEQDFIGDVDLADLTKESLNKVLNSVYTKGISDARKVLGEGVLRSIPDIVKNNVALTIRLREMSDNFYSQNEDLKPFKKVVGTVFEELIAKNPDKTYEEIMAETGTKAREILNLKAAATKPDQDKDKGKDGKPPRLPRKGGRSGKPSDKPNLEGLDKEISQMNATLRR